MSLCRSFSFETVENLSGLCGPGVSGGVIGCVYFLGSPNTSPVSGGVFSI